ncbi:MAG TPA: RNA polymerase sigma factor [Blastocatellia bacterium]|nr:RNA polymerase sigma factor [Blastocatellia bacterium]
MSDSELVKLMLAGEHDAFTGLYRRHQGRIYRFALLMSGSSHTAEEVTQEVFLVLIREAQRYDPSRGTFPAYLLGIARNQVLRILERERPFVPLTDESDDDSAVTTGRLISDDDPFVNCTRSEVIAMVRRAVLTLPARYREVVVLCDFQGMSYAEAALVMGCAVGTVNSRLHRGHALLLEKLRAARKVDSAAPAHRMRCFA